MSRGEHAQGNLVAAVGCGGDLVDAAARVGNGELAGGVPPCAEFQELATSGCRRDGLMTAWTRGSGERLYWGRRASSAAVD